MSTSSYVWNHHRTTDHDYTVNNLNQYTHDHNRSYSYDPSNRMTSATVGETEPEARDQSIKSSKSGPLRCFPSQIRAYLRL